MALRESLAEVMSTVAEERLPWIAHATWGPLPSETPAWMTPQPQQTTAQPEPAPKKKRRVAVPNRWGLHASIKAFLEKRPDGGELPAVIADEMRNTGRMKPDDPDSKVINTLKKNQPRIFCSLPSGKWILRKFT